MTQENNTPKAQFLLKDTIKTIAISVILSVIACYLILINSLDKKIDLKVSNYIENNPKEIIDSVNQFMTNKGKINSKKRDDFIRKNVKSITNQKFPSFGDLNSENIIIEFIDYNCGYCKSAFKTLEKVQNEKLDVKFIIIDFPILGENSVLKAKASIAASLLDNKKYFNFHDKLISRTNISDLDAIVAIAQETGYQKEAFENQISSQETTQILEKNYNLAKDFMISGTPAFIFGEKMLNQALSYEGIKKFISN